MNAWMGWALAAAALVVGWQGYGVQGLLFAFTIIVFWLLLQFNRSIRVMRDASEAPVGHVDSAVMLNAKLSRGMPLMQIVKLTKSLGRQISKTEDGKSEVWQWADAGGSTISVTVVDGRCTDWSLLRPPVVAEEEPTIPVITHVRDGRDTLPPGG